MSDARRRHHCRTSTCSRKRTIIIQIRHLRYSHAVSSNVTLTEERVQKVIRNCLETYVVEICPVRPGQFASYIVLYLHVRT